MRIKKLINFGIGVLLVVFVSSCFDLGDDVVPEPTAQSEQIKLEVYMDSLIAGGYDIDTTDLGVFYITIEVGEGEFPKNGDTLEVGYSAYYINGQLFDSSDLIEEDGTWEFVLGDPPLIPGWDNGMGVINNGAIVQLIVPSELAYGDTGYGIIDPYQTLIFVVEMKNIKPS